VTIGVGSYYPSARFSIPRSYVATVWGHSAGFALTQTANSFTLDFRPTFGSVYHWRFDPRWWVWSSNVWTLDHLITDSWYENPPDPTQIPLNFGLYWVRYAPDYLPSVRFAPNLSSSVPVQATFPTFPLSYWTRPT
jgi:hypothetical protein